MPIADTPLLQLEVAVATYWTGVPTVLPFAGALTDTVADAKLAQIEMQTRHQYFFMNFLPNRVLRRGGAKQAGAFSGTVSAGRLIVLFRTYAKKTCGNFNAGTLRVQQKSSKAANQKCT
jgi:hypothetical protein